MQIKSVAQMYLFNSAIFSFINPPILLNHFFIFNDRSIFIADRNLCGTDNESDNGRFRKSSANRSIRRALTLKSKRRSIAVEIKQDDYAIRVTVVSIYDYTSLQLFSARISNVRASSGFTSRYLP